MSKGQFVGITSPLKYKVTSSNINKVFSNIVNGSYYFAEDGSTGKFVSNNKGVHNSTATTTLTAAENMTLSFSYIVSSEARYDKFTIIIAGSVVGTFSGTDVTEKTWSGSLNAGDTIVFSYSKDSSANGGDDCASFYNMWATPTNGNQTMQAARKVKRWLFGVGGVARDVYRGHVGVGGVARTFLQADYHLQWPPYQYINAETHGLTVTYNDNGSRLYLYVGGAITGNNKSAGLVVNYMRGEANVMLKAGTVIVASVEVSHGGWADGGLVIVYADGTRDNSYYNGTFTKTEITLTKPGRIFFEATRHTEDGSSNWNGNESSLRCETQVSYLSIDGTVIYPTGG